MILHTATQWFCSADVRSRATMLSRRSTPEATQAIAEARKAGRDTMQTLTSSRCAFSQGVVLRRARAEPARRAAVSQCVVARAFTKASDFRRLTLEEIDQQVEEAKRSLLLDFRVKQVRSQKKPKCQLKWDLETKVAQLLTIKRERELEDKVSKRQSRSQQRSKNILAGFGNIH